MKMALMLLIAISVLQWLDSFHTDDIAATIEGLRPIFLNWVWPLNGLMAIKVSCSLEYRDSRPKPICIQIGKVRIRRSTTA